MFDWLKKKAGASRYVGLDMYDDGFAIAVVDGNDAGSASVTAARWYALGVSASKADVLSAAVAELGLRGLPVVATLPFSTYSMVQLEAPELDREELRDAMRWRVKDLIDFPVEQAIIDVFPLPPSRRPGAPALSYVVVAQAPEVEALAIALKGAGLRVAAIDVVEMAIRNLSLHLDKPDRPRAYLHLQTGQTVIEIADGSQVYLSRRVMQDFDADADIELLRAQMENLALEVQRSLDYFESQYALGAADKLSVIACHDILYEAFSGVAGTFLTVPSERFSFSAIATAEGVELGVLGRGVTALGAAMRELPWAA